MAGPDEPEKNIAFDVVELTCGLQLLPHIGECLNELERRSSKILWIKALNARLDSGVLAILHVRSPSEACASAVHCLFCAPI